jgi:hypothetical protein
VARFRVFLLLGIVVAVLAPVASAHAATTAARSCVDLDNDGVCGANEPTLGPILDANFGSLDTTVASPGYTPPGGSVGVILTNYSTNNDTLSINATGDVRVNGKVKAKHVESVDIETLQDVIVGASASLTFGGGRCCLSDVTVFAHDVTFGTKSQLKAGGDDSFWDVEAKNITFGDGVKINAKGADTDAFMQADNRMFFGLRDQFLAASSGEIDLYSFQSVVATGLKIVAGTIDIEAFPPEDGHIPGREIDLTDSLVNQNGTDGSLTMLAGDTSAPKATDKISFVNTRVFSRSGAVDIEPTPAVS